MEPQSTLSGFSVQTNRASCVFVRQKVFCQTKTNLPSLMIGGFSSKVGKSETWGNIRVQTIKIYKTRKSKIIVTKCRIIQKEFVYLTNKIEHNGGLRDVFRRLYRKRISTGRTVPCESSQSTLWRKTQIGQKSKAGCLQCSFCFGDLKFGHTQVGIICQPFFNQHLQR